MAASLRAAAAVKAKRILCPPAVLPPVPGEGLRRLVHTNQHSAPARASKKVTKWTVAALVGVAGAIAVGALATSDGAEDWPHCHRCGGILPRTCVLCGQNLPRPIAEAMQAASKCGQASGAAQNQKETGEAV